MNATPPSQARAPSLAEAVANVAIGYLLAIAVQRLVYPLFGIVTSLGEDSLIAGVFMAVSLGRSYALRRLFLHLERCHLRQEAERLARLEQRFATGRLK